MNPDFQPILTWYQNNARRLPWRADQDPYRVWVSEIMLQQTTVATVAPYFQKFMTLWPTVQLLAQAELEEILHAWQGLGYYRRARYLHEAAQLIAKNGWPKSSQELKSLPGVGSYTSRAIAAIAWNENTLPVDGNIARVMARVLGLKGLKNNIIKQLEQRNWGHIPEPGYVAQALMDLGQAVCTPRQPLCGECPLQSQCQAPASQPFEDVRTRQKELHSQAICMADDRGMLMCEPSNRSAPSDQLLKGLWGPFMNPWREQPYEKGIIPDHQHKDLAYCGSVTHIFSHIRLKVDVYKSGENMKLPHLPFSRLAQKIINLAHIKDSKIV